MEKKLKSLFKILLLREEDMDYNSPFWLVKWIDIKIDLLTCPEIIEEIKKIAKEEK